MRLRVLIKTISDYYVVDTKANREVTSQGPMGLRRHTEGIGRSNFDVLEQRIRVPTWEKLSILASAALR
jgi:hypothetical protein